MTLTMTACLLCAGALAESGKPFTETFGVDKSELAAFGTNRFCILAPGYQLVLEGKEGRRRTVLTITVLPDRKLVDGVETAVVEERETANGQIVEISRNFLAISKQTRDVFYFGEDVDIYKGGRVVSHDGAWISGMNGARFGLMIPGRPLIGARYYQELAPKVAMDRAEVTSLTGEMSTPAGMFRGCLVTEETSAIEKVRDHKVYAMGVGLISDGQLKLVHYGFAQ
jgi:hypothetical protein